MLRDQKKIAYVGLGLIVAAFWIVGQLGEWTLGICISIGVLLGLLNHLATEFWLLRILASGGEISRSQMIRSTMVRLVILTLVAVGVAVAFWPSGIGLLLGLALFRLHRPGDDDRPVVEGAEEGMIGIAPLEIEIHPGEHVERDFLGLVVNIDTIISTFVAMAIVLILGFWARSALTKQDRGPRAHQDPDHLGVRGR